MGIGIACGLAALSLILPAPTAGQDSSGGWIFAASTFSDLWFHGMALVDPVGPGPNPLYDPGYPSVIRAAKDRSAARPSALDQGIPTLRNAFRSDPAFQVLHFLPLYFPQAGRTEVLSALALLSGTGEGIPRAPSARTTFGLAAIGSVLTTPGQRRVLGEFVSALEDEWTAFYEGFLRDGTEARTALEGQVNQLWRRDYVDALRPFLEKAGMSGGAVFLVPALGFEGRVFGGSPQVDNDNVLAVAVPGAGREAHVAVFSMLRELAFPVVREVMRDQGLTGGDPVSEERLASTAAIQVASLVVQRYTPQDQEAVRRFFLGQSTSAQQGGGSLENRFNERFPLPPALMEALRSEFFFESS